MEISLDIPAGPMASATARRCLEALRDHVRQGAFEDIRLLVSELVANSSRHAGLREGEPIHVSVRADRDPIRAEVSDEGRGFVPALSEQTDESGWGLRLVERLAERWGVQREPRTTVWFEISGARAS